MSSILIIDDDPSCIDMMETILYMEGFDVRSASDGQSGLSLTRETRPDLILCDIMMPNMDGHELLKTLNGEPGLSDIPFIYVTALGERIDIRRGMSAGADDYLPKPFSAEELLAAVAGRIHRREKIIQQYVALDFAKERSILKKRVTAREREILGMVGLGVKSRQIAKCLNISQKTVTAHRANLMKKLGAGNAAALARWAVIAELP